MLHVKRMLGKKIEKKSPEKYLESHWVKRTQQYETRMTCFSTTAMRIWYHLCLPNVIS